jgi:aspartyl-tRNA(Asn)/glutamyl-tRNA(Gln) amidotransferase subunit C
VQIDKKIVENVAILSRLELDEKESALYSGQLASILSYIGKLNEVDTKDVPPTSHVLPNLKNVFRKDVLKDSLDVDDALSNAPQKEGDLFKVPQVIDPSALRLRSGPMVSKVEPSAGLRVYPEQGRGIEGK